MPQSVNEPSNERDLNSTAIHSNESYWLKTQTAKDFIEALTKSRFLDSSDLRQVVIIENPNKTITALLGFFSLDKITP